MNTARLINQTSGNVEYYTPQEIVEAARATMGRIDLDPASSEAANARVKAKRFFTRAENGLSQEWVGRVWMNHPFGRATNEPWIAKLVFDHVQGRVTEACCISYACTSEQWFYPLLNRPQCFLVPRTNYILPDGSVKRGVSKGSVVTYFGENVQRFAECFQKLGVVKAPL